METRRFRVQVFLTLSFDVEGTREDDTMDRGAALACARPGIKREHITAVTASQILAGDAAAARSHQELEALKLGTYSQRQRMACGLLPESELLEIVRRELFRPFGMFPRRRKLTATSIPHPRLNTGGWRCSSSPRIIWLTTRDPSLDHDQWERLLKLEAGMDEIRNHPWLRKNADGCTLSVVEHRGICSECGQTAAQHSALVSLVWAERQLSREYLL